jgi:hypothetical protein
MTTDIYSLHTIDYSVQGWDSILATDMEKLDDVIHSRFLATLGEAVGVKKAVYMDSVASKYKLAQADGTKQPAIGVTLESGVLDDVVRAQRTGLVTDATWTWTVGGKVYLHPTVAGSLTQTKPDVNIQTLGIAVSPTTIFLTHIVVRYDHPNHTGDVTSVADGVQTIANKQTLSATAPITVSNTPTVVATVAPVIAIPAATASVDGYVTSSQITKLNGIEALADVTDAENIASSIVGVANKVTPVDADSMGLIDSAAANVLKETTWANIKTTLKTYFDTLYNLYTHPNHTGDVTSVADGATTITANAVTNAKAAQMATKTYKGRTTAATGNAEDVPVAIVKADLVLVKADVGLDVVDNTADSDKPVSTAQQTALDLKAPFDSPIFTGNVKRSVQSGITAFAGGGQASAVVITEDIAEISVCATAGDSVKLPTASAGLSIFITNHGVMAADVFPNTDDAINEAAVNTAKSVAVIASMLCISYNATNWECLTLAR